MYICSRMLLFLNITTKNIAFEQLGKPNLISYSNFFQEMYRHQIIASECIFCAIYTHFAANTSLVEVFLHPEHAFLLQALYSRHHQDSGSLHFWS